MGVEAARRLGNDHRLAVIAGNLATAYSHRGAVAEAEKGFREALEAFRRLDDEWNLAGALHQLGRPATDQGRIEEARDLYNRSLGDQHGMANTLGQLGNLARRRGAPEEAQGFFGRCMEVFERLGE